MSAQLRLDVLREAKTDLKFLLERGYRRRSALKLIGDRYQLSRAERSILYRSVMTEQEASIIRSKHLKLEQLEKEKVIVDGFNVLNTIEAMLRGEPLILCDDGVLRDILEMHSKYKPSQLTARALGEILGLLKRAGVAEIEVLYESQISRSGEIAGLTRRMLSEIGLRGDARTAKTVDSLLIKSSEIVATSDSAILLKCRAFIDVPQNLASIMGAKVIAL
ncbi:MAG: DUF434 domain-containing protein [Nitrososphaerota archaeon]